MEKIRPLWRIVIGFLLLMLCVYNSNNLTFGGSYLSFAVSWALLAAFVYLSVKIKYDDPLRSLRDVIAAQPTEKAAETPRAQSADLKAPASVSLAGVAEPQDDGRGRLVTAIAGVTFKNEDGSDRQAILKDLKACGEEGQLNLEEYEYKGRPSIRVSVDGECIGSIPRSRVPEVSAVLDCLDSARLNIEAFRPEDEGDWDEDKSRRHRGELIYRADLILTYTK